MTENRANTTLSVQGMTCGSCQRHVTEALKGVAGVVEAEVDLRTGLANITYDPAVADAATMIGAIADAGYRGALASEAASLPVQSGCGCSSCG